MLDRSQPARLHSSPEDKEISEHYPLHRCCKDGNVADLKFLLNQLQLNVSNAEILISEDLDYNWTAGHFAAYFGKVSNLVYFGHQPSLLRMDGPAC